MDTKDVGAIIRQINFAADDDLSEDVRRQTLHELAWVLVNATREEDTNG